MELSELTHGAIAAIEVKNAFKYYDQKVAALRGLNMKVAQGTIYGLLGPSGCGKTTLLTALIGQLKLNAGEIQMTVNSKSEIGYMPQSLTLFQEFTIREHMMYYGLLYYMESQRILTRTKELIEFLELPHMNSIISSLSGGEQRRVSLCIALLHNPPLLILDEPTVGTDVVLCQSIWKNLLYMSNTEGKTIVITTHYIEEARHSNVIGLMRNGRILAESDPNQLMVEHQAETLEAVFLKLCRQEVTSDDYGDVKESECLLRRSAQTKLFPKSKSVSWTRIRAYSLKNMYWMKRNIPMMLFTLVLPMVQCALISIAVGEDPRGLSLGYVNDESDCTSASIGCTPDFNLSCTYLNILRAKSLNLVPYPDLDLALADARQNRIWGVLFFNKNYSTAILNRLRNKIRLNNETLRQSEVDVWLDESNQVIGLTLKKYVALSVVRFIQQVILTCDFSIGRAELPVKLEEPVFGSKEPNFRQFMTPANAVLFEFYLPMMFTVGGILMEKTSGLLGRGIVAGITLVEIGIGHVGLQFVILSVQTLFMMVVLFGCFENPIEGSIVACVAFLLLVGTCGMFYGFFVAAVSDSFTTAACLAIGSYFPLFMLSGAIWPLEGMHWILRLIANFLPITTSVEAFRALSVRSWPLTHVVVYSSVFSLIAWSLIFIYLTSLAIKYKGIT